MNRYFHIVFLLLLSPIFAQDKILFIRGGGGTVGFFEGGSDEQGASISNFIDDRKNHGWGELATALEAEGFLLEEASEDSPTPDSPVPLETMNLSQYAVIVFGSNNASYSTAQIEALENYIIAGGAALFISDANFGSNWPDAASSDSQLLAPFGLQVNQDRGTYSLRRSSGDFLLPNHPIFAGVDRFDGEGVSPGTIVDASAAGATILSRVASGQQIRRNPQLFAGGQGSSNSATANDGTLIVATPGNGRVAIHFDRNTFFNLNGAGTNLNRFDNERYARNLFHWLANSTPSSNAGPRAHFQKLDAGISALPGEEVTLEAIARDLDGSISSVELFINDSKISELDAEPFEWTVSNLQAGENILTLRTTDNEGAVTENHTVVTLSDPGVFRNPLDRTEWTFVSSHNNVQSGNDNLKNAIDGTTETRWATRTPQIGTMFFRVDLGSEQSFKAIRLETPDDPNDYPRAWTVRGSNDDSDYLELLSGIGEGTPTEIVLPETVNFRYLRIEQTASPGIGNWWSIAEINLYNPQNLVPTKAEWIARFFPPSPASDYADTADFDGDGLTTLMEFALNTNPTINNPTSPLKATYQGIKMIDLTFPRWKTDNTISYLIETSEDLVTWKNQNDTVTMQGEPSDNGDGTETVTFRTTLPAESDEGFVRLRIQESE